MNHSLGADATEFFARYIHPNLPPGIKPKRTLLELHSLFIAPGKPQP